MGGSVAPIKIMRLPFCSCIRELYAALDTVTHFSGLKQLCAESLRVFEYQEMMMMATAAEPPLGSDEGGKKKNLAWAF